VHTSEDIYTYEEKTWGITSTELSKLLLNKWNIPEDIVTGIAEHRSIDSQSKLAKVVYVANEFANVVTDGHYKSSMTYPIFLKLLKEFSLTEIEFNRFSNMIPDIVERGKMIMKVMSKKHGTPPIRRRMITRATLITPYEYSLSKCLLELIGFSVELFTPEEVTAYQEFLKAEEELRKLEYDDRFKTNLDINKSLEEEEKKLEEKKAGLFSRLFGAKKKAIEEEASDEPEEPKVKAINWNPLVVFELCHPAEIDRASVTSYQVLRDPSQISGAPIPFFFANPDIKTK
jgi:hypothetical protein